MPAQRDRVGGPGCAVALDVDLREAIATLPPPRTLKALRGLQDLLEYQALRAALEASGWVPERAARALGAAHGSSIQKALARHPALAAEVARRRGTAKAATRQDATR